MKTKSILAIAMIFGIFACKKDEKSEPTPSPAPAVSLAILTGYYSFGSFGIKEWANQSTIAADSIKANEYFGIKFTEANLPNADDIEFDSVKFAFDVNTTNDVEHFIGGTNTAMSSKSKFSIGSRSEITGEYGIPYKFGVPAVKGNDTLEFSNANDFAKIDYISKISTQKGNRTLNITK